METEAIRYEECSDEELILRERQGEREITDYLVEKYKELVRIRAHTMYLMGGEKDDLIQEGMIGLFKAVRDYQPNRDTSFRTFAALCIDRQLYTAIQGCHRQKHLPLNTYVPLDAGEDSVLQDHWSENPETIMIDRENAETLMQGIRKMLSPMENQVLKYYLDGYTYMQMGEFLNKSPKSMYNALQRIREKIRNYLEHLKSAEQNQRGTETEPQRKRAEKEKEEKEKKEKIQKNENKG